MKLDVRTILTILLSIFLLACADTVKDKGEYVDEAQIETFGFYVEDNPGLAQDVIVEVIGGSNEIKIPLSRGIDKASLVARYTTMNDKAEVMVGSVKQENGVTANNFTEPQDYYVTVGEFIRRYTVTITVAADILLEKLEPFTREELSDFLMKVSPVSGTPYVMFKKRTGLKGAVMIKYENDKWSYVGSSDGFSEGGIGQYDFTFDQEGQPYVVFQDQAEMVNKNALTVMYYDQLEHEWILRGKEITTAKVDMPTITLSQSNEIIIVGKFDGRKGPLERRTAVVSYYSNGVWKTDEVIPGKPSSQQMQFTRSKLHNKVNYFAMLNFKPQTYSIYSYKDGIWETIADDMIEEGATHTYLNGFYMDVDGEGNIYVLSSDDALVSGSYKPRLKKYDVKTQTWSQVASVFDILVDSKIKMALTVATGGVPLVMYMSPQGEPMLTMYDVFTGHWADEIRLDTSKASDMYIDYHASSKKGYIGFDNSAGNFVLYQFLK